MLLGSETHRVALGPLLRISTRSPSTPAVKPVTTNNWSFGVCIAGGTFDRRSSASPRVNRIWVVEIRRASPDGCQPACVVVILKHRKICIRQRVFMVDDDAAGKLHRLC